MLIAIQPDNFGPDDTSSPLWERVLREAGHEIRIVDVFHSDIIEKLMDCQGFMWRHGHSPAMRQIAKRLLPVIERALGLVIYPDQNTCWHYDDKIAQTYLFKAAGIPIPQTFIWYEKDAALAWSKNASYPLVLKLWSGAGSTNVCLIHSYDEAEHWIVRLFGSGVRNLKDRLSLKQRFKGALRLLLKGKATCPWELHKNYAYFQEFLSENSHDTRITIIGNRAFGFRRFNRENDFRASGSGKIDPDPKGIDTQFVQLAFNVAKKLKTQSCAIDGLWRGEEAVVGEISYTYASWAVKQCPGYWDADLYWHAQSMWPEEAQIQDFIMRLETKFYANRVRNP